MNKHFATSCRFLIPVFTTLFLTGNHLKAGEWPQFRGPTHDGVCSEKISTVWPSEGLKAIWKVPVTDGFSSFALGGGSAYTCEVKDVEGARQEVCIALDCKTGKELWSTALGIAKYDGGGENGAPGNSGGDGPRSTPSYSDGRVYAYSTRMLLKCLDAKTGNVIWSHDVIKDNAGRNIHWGNAASPLIDGGLIFLAGGGPGEALMALDKKDGNVKWKTADDGMTHSTPVIATILGQRQVIFFTQTGLVALKPENGSELWRFPFKFKGAIGISPVVAGDVVYCSEAYGIGSAACKIAKTGEVFSATQIWFEPANVLNSHWSTPVQTGGYLYGLFGQAKYAAAPLQCVEIATGKAVWSQSGFGPGGCVLIDGHILVLSDAGDLVLVEASPKAYKETARSHILAGKCWNGVAIENGLLYARSTKEATCVSIAP
jgi:outer membrane protein assembly factor BamB